MENDNKKKDEWLCTPALFMESKLKRDEEALKTKKWMWAALLRLS